VRRITCRRFFTVLTAAGVASALLSAEGSPAQAPRPAQNVSVLASGSTGSKAVLTKNDLTYLGMFQMPTSVNGNSTMFNEGVAFRRVGGQKRLLAAANLYEVAVPQESIAGPYNTAALVHFWGGLAQSSWYWGQIRGLYWDETDKRIYQVMGDYYNQPPADQRVVFYATLNETTGVPTVYGPWGLTNQSFKMSMGGVTGIPQWFANTYLGGKRIGLGFGGPYSTLTNGPASMGPALTAIAAPPTTTPQFSRLNDTRLLAYPFSNTTPEYSRPYRSERTPDYNLKPSYKPPSMWFDGGAWSPKTGVGYWQGVDYIEAAGCWIDTTTKHGVLFAPVVGTGDMWYEQSDIRYQGLKHIWMMYNPMDLAAVASGNKGSDQVQAVWKADVQYANNVYPLVYPTGSHDPTQVGFGLPSYQVPKGMAFDPVESRLYILMGHHGFQHLGPPGNEDLIVYVYQVS
jgi:hypothetical protein